jgi:hypothetical protein
MATRFLDATPRQLLAMSPAEMLTAIRISEGRVIMVTPRIRCGTLVDHVSNAEVAAAFGADILDLTTYEPFNPRIPGWPSKNPADDEAGRDLQILKGEGYTLQEIRELVGRPVALLLVLHTEDNKSDVLRTHGNILATMENAEKAVASGADMIVLTSWAPSEQFPENLKRICKALKGKAILEYTRPHGSGLIETLETRQVLISEDEIRAILDAGVDIIGLPAPGTYPGFTVDRVARLVDLIHSGGAMVSLGVHTTQESADLETLREIAILAKQAGADIHELGDSGYNLVMVEPQNIMAYSIAIRGCRHTYRRMAMSIKR